MKPYNIGSIGYPVKIKCDEGFKCGKGSTYNDYFWCNAKYGVEIGENTLIGQYVTIHSANHVIKNIEIEQNANDKNSWCKCDRNKRTIGKKVTIGNDVWIGSGVIILPGSNIPDKCVIGAGCIITESNSKRLNVGDIVVTESPLRIIGNRNEWL